MLNWAEFETQNPDMANVGSALLRRHEVAFLATVSKFGKPRIHPMVPKSVSGKMVAFIIDSSPKIQDLRQRQFYSIHTLPDDEDTEFTISGIALEINDDLELRRAAEQAMGFATGVDAHHILFEFGIDRALTTRWLDFGTEKHRPQYQRFNHVATSN